MSNFLNLNWNDFGKGLVVAVLTVVVGMIGDIIATGGFPTGPQWKAIGLAGLSAAIAYILKNLLTNSEGKLLRKEPVKIAVKS